MIEKRRNPLFTVLIWLPVAAWAGVIWRLLTLPSEETPDITFLPFSDKLGHCGLYFIWGLLVCWAVEKSFHRLSRLGIGAVTVLAGGLYGAASEIYQSSIGREADALDLLADTAGALIGQYLYFSARVRSALSRLVVERIRGARHSHREVLSSVRRDVEEKQQGTKS